MFGQKFLILALVASSLALLVASQNSPVADAGGFENEQISSDGEATYRIRRAWKVATVGRTLICTGVRVKRSNETGSTTIKVDGLRFVASADGRLALGLSYFDKDISAETNLDSTTTFGLETSRAGFAVRFQSLIVYNETNGQVGYQDSDTLINTINLDDIPRVSGAPWAFNVEAVGVRTTSDGNNVRSVTVRSTNGVFAMRLFVGDIPFRVDGNSVRPDEVKITLVVNTTRLAAFSQSGYKIAIRAVVISAASRVSAEGTTSQEVSVSGDAMVKTAFNWAKNVNITGAGVARLQAGVHTEINNQYSNSTVLGGFSGSFTATRLTWSFATDVSNIVGRVLEWDPAAAASVDYAALDATASPASSVAASLFGLVLIVLLGVLLF